MNSQPLATTLAALTLTLAGFSHAPALAQADTPEAAMLAGDASPTDILIEQRLTAFRDWAASADRRTLMSQVQAKTTELLDGIDIATLNPRQIERIIPLLLSAQGPLPAARERLETLTGPDTLDGLLAITVSTTLDAYAAQKQPDAAAVERIITHPSFNEAVREGHILTPFISLSIADPASLKPHAEAFAAASAHLDGATLDPEQAQALTRYWGAIQGVVPATDEQTLDSVRARVANALRAVAERQTDADLVSSLKDQIAQIDGAHARGELVDHPAPEVEFLWTSDGTDISSLGDLEGRVVVVDFWATWCGPCIQSFPSLAQLVEHYEGYPVTVVGVTAPQGRHHGADGTVTTTGGDREQEFALMTRFMKAKNVSWPMAFSEQAAWTEFGVRGIPHVAIIDAKGVVRHNGLHPMLPMAQKTQMIDALLKEAGHETPEG